ncbi:MAG TPA: molybdopterin molybdenumtransferase MoeA [Proteobacteria bacterium]|nr:molybdopterin molybdenumtransferase MoeA [Pseudomonadota bacterium]
MEKYIEVERAQALILEDCRACLPLEKVDLLAALDRVLGEPVTAFTDLPMQDNSAMDGYGLRAAETKSATPENPLRMPVVAEVPAGTFWPGPLPVGTAVRIMTGAPLPPGVDAVIRREFVEEFEREIVLAEAVPVANDIRRAGEDIQKGELVLAAGVRLTPAAIGMLAAVGRPFVSVVRRPRVAVLATGDEIVDFHQSPEPGKIRNSNSFSLAALVRQAGAEPQIFPLTPDRPEAIRQALLAAVAVNDLVLTSGGVSMGDYDFLQEVIGALPQAEIRFWQVRMKPGKPLLYSRIGDKPVLGLPGNPVSTMVAFEQFARPLLRKMAGWPENRLFLSKARARLLEDLPSAGNRRHYIRGIRGPDADGKLTVKSTGAQGSGILSSMVRGDCLIVQPAGAAGIQAGSQVEIELLDY